MNSELLHQDIFGGVLRNPWNSLPFIFNFFAVIFAEKPLRQTWHRCLCGGLQRETERENKTIRLFPATRSYKYFSQLKRGQQSHPPERRLELPTCDDLHPSSAKLNAKWCEKRICWRDSLISRMCDHTLKPCTFPFPPRHPRGLLLRINAPRPLLLFSRPARVLSWSGVGDAVSLTARQSSQVMKHRVLRMWQETHICVSLICGGVVPACAAQK